MKSEYSQAVTYAIGKAKKQVKDPSENLFNQMLFRKPLVKGKYTRT